MKKVMLGLVMVVMLMSMVGCGTTEKNEESEVTTEMKEVVNGITGEKEPVKDTQVNEKTMMLYAEVIEISVGTTVDENTEYYKFEFSMNDIVSTFGIEYPIDSFEVGDVVKFTMGVRNYGGPDLPDTNNIISWEKSE